MLKVKVFTINESVAKLAKEMNSFSDYKDGSTTASYLSTIATFEKEVNELLEYNKRKSYSASTEKLELVAYLADKYSEKLAYLYNQTNIIRSRCPSVMISGPANFPVKKKEKQNAAIDKLYRELGELYSPTDNYYYRRIYSILTDSTIRSNDEFAIERLEGKIADYEALHEKMKARNAYYRKNGTMKGFEDISDDVAEKWDNRIKNGFSWQQCPHPSWELSNNNAEIRRLKGRLEELKRLKATPKTPEELALKYPKVDGVTVEEDTEEMRIRLIFDDIPDEETRSLLKSHGMKWSPRNQAWQRQLTDNGVYAVKRILQALAK